MEHSKPKYGLAPKIVAGMLLCGALLILLSATPKSLLAGLTTISRDSDGSATIVLLRPDGDCGDLNGDRQIDVSDVVFQLQVIVGLANANPDQRFLGDVTQDGDITVLDAITIVQYIVGQRGPFEKCGPTPTPTPALVIFQEAYSFTAMPSPGQTGTAWDPQIGVRIAISEAVRSRNSQGDNSTSIYKIDDVAWNIPDIGNALSLVLCSDENCTDAQPVAGESRTLYGGIGGSEEGEAVLLDFFPDTPLFGGKFYKFTISESTKIVWGANELLLRELLGLSAVQFSTAEMTRFVLPINLKYDNSNCLGGNIGQFAENTGLPMCRNIEQVSELLYGTSEHQFTHYFNAMSTGKTFAFSPLKDKQGFVRPAIEIDRGKDYEPLGYCFRGAEIEGRLPFPACPNEVGDGPSVDQQMAEIFDLDRYRIRHEDGTPNVLAPYRPSRENTAAIWANDVNRGDQIFHRNVTTIYNYGTFQNATLGSASQPTREQDAEFTISNEERTRTWVHELGHALFGLPDLYYHGGVGAATYNVGYVDIMGDNAGAMPPLTAWSLMTSELAEPEPLISDLEMSNFIYMDGYQLPDQEWSPTPGPAIPAVPATPAVTFIPERAFVEMQKHGVGGVDGLVGVRSVTISTDGRNVYAAGYYSNAIAVFSRDLSTGALTFVEVHKDEVDGVDGLAGVRSVTVSTDGRNVYAAGYYSNAIAVFSRVSSTGALTFVEVHKDGVDGVDGLDGAISVTVSPDDRNVYAAGTGDNAIAVFSRDSSAGALTFDEVHRDEVDGVDGIAAATSVTVSHDGGNVYAAGTGDNAVAVFTRESSTGALAYVEMYEDGDGSAEGLDGVSSVTVSPDDSNVYTAGTGDNAVAVFTRDSSTGALAYVEMYEDGVGSVDGLDGVSSVTVSPDGSNVYAAGTGNNAVAVFTRDSSTGALAYVEMYEDGVGSVDGLDGVSSVTVSPDDSNVYAAGFYDYAIAVFSPHTIEQPDPVIIKRAVPAVPEEPASTAYAGCGATNDKCVIYDNTQPDFKILKVPAILERDTGEVKGHYLIEFYGTTGYSSEITLAPDTVNFSDQPGAFPGGIAIWKIDNTEQKVMTDICRTLFGSSESTLAWCNQEAIFNNGTLTHLPEFYPMFPTISAHEGGTGISSFHLFPWWYSPGLPFGDEFEQDLSDMPYSIELPVLEIAAYGTSTSETTDFGGGSKVAIITLTFQSLVDELKSRIRSANDSGQIQLSEFETYETNGSAEFTLQIRELEFPVPMTYADHIRPGQMEFVTGNLADEVLKYGYHIHHR